MHTVHSFRGYNVQFSDLDSVLAKLEPELKEVLNRLLDPRLFSVDRGELHILLHHSKSLSEFHSLVRDVESTLTEVLDSDESMADMYLSHQATLRCILHFIELLT